MNTPSDQYLKDLAETLRNRERLAANPNLIEWYRQLYAHQFADAADLEKKVVLEIGSGISPLKKFHPNVLTSDVLKLDHLDLVFDCHQIDRVADIRDESVDIITLTNVMHHLKDPIDFLTRATRKLKPGGKIVATEPYFSIVSSPVYKHVHHEPVVFELEQPVLGEVTGPLASANIALPHLIFFSSKNWQQRLREHYTWSDADVRYFTSLSYMVTGGISRRLPLPRLLYGWYFRADLALSQLFPRVFASFFTISLTRI